MNKAHNKRAQSHSLLMSNAEGEGKGSKPAANNSMVNAVALFDKGGSLIYMGQSKGTITVLDTASLKFLDFVKVRGVYCMLAYCQSLEACTLPMLSAVVLHTTQRNTAYACTED